MFKVVTDQLKVSQGWVRCGQCAQVFDAQQHLQSTHDPVAVDASTIPPVVDLTSDPPTEALPQYGSLAPSYEQEVIAALKARHTGATSSPASVPVAAGPALVSTLSVPDRDVKEIDNPTDKLAELSLETAHSGDLNDVSFIRRAHRQGFWRKPSVRALLVLVAFCLAGLLSLQLTLQHRDALLAFEPRLRPALQILCDQLHCRLGASRRIEAIVIESSSFTKAEGTGNYRLGFTLKNASTAVVAMPFLEVSLTDTEDQAVIRRVLSPAQFGAANGVLVGSGEFSNSMTLQVLASTPAPRIAGYRLLAYYP